MDCTFNTELGNFNFRVGIIITDGRRILMAKNPNDKREYYYSVGGRVKFGESLEDAVKQALTARSTASPVSTRISLPMTTVFRSTRSRVSLR